MSIKLRMTLILAVIVGLLAGTIAVYGAPAERTTRGVNVFDDPPPAPVVIGAEVEGASSTLVRNDDGIAMTFQTSGLEPGVYTLWWSIINSPPGVTDSFIWVAGHVVGADGLGNFGAYVREGNPPGEVFRGDPAGLTDARGAEIHIVLKYHGPAIPGMLREQISTFLGGCTINSCGAEQISIHP